MRNGYRDYIKHLVDDINLFSYYLKLDTKIIEDCIINKTKINNPLRVDKHPSASFKYRRNGTLVLIDYARKEYSGDIFHIVGIIKNLNSNKNTDFIKICKSIINDTITNKEVYSSFKNIKLNYEQYKEITKTTINYKKITVEYKSWDTKNFKYWYDFVRPNKELGIILLKTLQEHNIYPIERYWINNNNRASKVATIDNPIYAYLLKINKEGIREYKLYSPFEKFNKFRTNSKDIFNYFNKNMKNDVLIISKSVKDMILLKIMFKYLHIDYIDVITVNSESNIIKPEDMEIIKKNYSVIFTFYDYDKIGILYSFYMNSVFNTIPLFLYTIIDYRNSYTNDDLKPIINRINKYIDYKINNIDFGYFLESHTFINETSNTEKDLADYLFKYGIEDGINVVNHLIYHEIDT